MLTSGPARRPSHPVGPTCPPGCQACTPAGCRVSVLTPSAPPLSLRATPLPWLCQHSAHACPPPCPSLTALSPWGLSIQPHVFHAPAVVYAIDHHRQPLHLGLPAGGKNIVKNDRASSVFLQFPVDLPYQPLALVLIGHRGLFVELLV